MTRALGIRPRLPNGRHTTPRSWQPIAVPGGALRRRWITAARHAHLWDLPIDDAAASFELDAEQVLRAWRALYPREAVRR